MTPWECFRVWGLGLRRRSHRADRYFPDASIAYRTAIDDRVTERSGRGGRFGVIAVGLLWSVVAARWMGDQIGLAGLAAVLAFVVYWFPAIAFADYMRSRVFRKTLTDFADEFEVRPGRCIQCGYDLSHFGRDACPECGAPIPGLPRTGEGPTDA